jgi:hypothetical protein
LSAESENLVKCTNILKLDCGWGSNVVQREYRSFTVHTYSKSTIHNKRFYLNLGTATQLKGSGNSRHGSEVVLTLSEEMLGQG